jgi:hypothetical protein
MREELGKITSAEFGCIRDYPFLMGLHLRFETENGSVGDGGKYVLNMSPECKWESEERKFNAMERILKFTYDLLNEAKVNNVSELIGKPVRVYYCGMCFDSFKILKEVL